MRPAFPNNWDEVFEVFDWNNISLPTAGDGMRLKAFLKKEFATDGVGNWIDNLEFQKTDNNKTISIFDNMQNKLSITLDEDIAMNPTKATLNFGKVIYEFSVRIDKSNLGLQLYTRSGSITADSHGKSYERGQIYLDSNYQSILQSTKGHDLASKSWIVLKNTSGDAAVYEIVKANEKTMGDFSLSRQ